MSARIPLVTPAAIGIQVLQSLLDSGFRQRSPVSLSSHCRDDISMIAIPVTGGIEALKNGNCADIIQPELSDSEVSTTDSGGRKARPYEKPANSAGRDEVYPRPH
jgi:hypothetical protein